MRNCPGDISIERELDDPLPSVTWNEPIASDLSGHVNMTSSHTSGMAFNLNSTLVTYTFTDNANNVATCQFEVFVREGKQSNEYSRDFWATLFL